MKNIEALAKKNLKLSKIGQDQRRIVLGQLSNFVRDNWHVLYEGACRLHVNIEEDYYASARIQINKTRLNPYIGVKYANGHKYNSPYSPCEKDLLQAIDDIQLLLDEASKTIECSFTFKVIQS